MAGAAGGKEVGRISIRVVPNTTRFREDLRSDLERIEKELKATIAVNVDLDTLKARGDMAVLMAKLKAEGARGVTINTNIDKDKLGGFLSSAGGGAGGAASSLGGMSRGLAIVAAVAAFAAPALALISGVLITLPALITAVLVPIAAIALGLDGLKKAAEVLKAPLDGLKQTMSQAFQDKFTPIFTKLKDIFPVLNQEMPKVANGLGDMASAFVDSVTSAPGMEAIRNTISNIGTALSAAAPGVSNFTDGFLKLISSVSNKLPNLSKIFNGWGDSFTNWVNKITTPSWFDGKTPLDNGLKSFKDTLVEILNLVGDLATNGFKFLSDPNFGKSMTDFVNTLKSLVNDVLPGLGKFFMDLSGAIKDASDAIHSFDSQPQADAKAAAIAQGQANQDKGAGDANLPAWIDPEGWGISIRQWFTKIGPEIAAWGKTTWGQFTASFTQQWGVISAAWGANWESLKSAASTAWNGVVSAVQTGVSSIGSFFTGIPTALSSAWSSLGSIASTAWNAVVSAVSNAMSGAVSAVVNGAAQVVAAVVGLGAKVVSACANFGSLLVGAGAALVQGLINGITSLAQAAIDKAVGIATSVANAVKGALGIHSPSTVFTEIGANTMLGLQNGLDGGVQGVLDRATSLAQQITDAINNGLTGVDGKVLSDQLKQQMAEIGLQSDQLKVQLNGTTDKDQKKGIRDQRAQLQSVRDQLNLQQDQLGFSQKYGDSLDKNDNIMGDTLDKMVSAGAGFATATMKQAQTDLGIGGGALTAGLDQGIGFGMSMLSKLISGAGTTINVGSVDDALAVKQNQANKRSLQFQGR